MVTLFKEENQPNCFRNRLKPKIFLIFLQISDLKGCESGIEFFRELILKKFFSDE
jgi:hypothetical protein